MLLCCLAGHQTVAPPVDPFGVRAVLRTLPLGRRWPLAFGDSLLGPTAVCWCRAGPLFLGARASLSGAVVPDAAVVWGFCAMRGAVSACRRRVAPLHGAIPPVEGPVCVLGNPKGMNC